MNIPSTQYFLAGKRSFITMILISLICLATSASVTYAPPPAVNFTQLVQLNYSAQGSTFIGSKRLECLELTQNGGSTTFKLTYFNRSASNNINQYMIAN
jgi:hypothetical protein